MPDLSPLTVLRLFQKIPDQDCELLNLDRVRGRPEDMLVTQLIVPPACIRPSVSMGSSGTNEDDLTIKLCTPCFAVPLRWLIAFLACSGHHSHQQLHQAGHLQGRADHRTRLAVFPCRFSCSPRCVTVLQNLIENWDFLQQQVAMYVNSDLPGFPKAAVKPIRALSQRLKVSQSVPGCFCFSLHVGPVFARAGQDGSLPRQSQRQACGLLGPYCHFARPQPAR